jgi:hypothetical protein
MKAAAVGCYNSDMGLLKCIILKIRSFMRKKMYAFFSFIKYDLNNNNLDTESDL